MSFDLRYLYINVYYDKAVASLWATCKIAPMPFADKASISAARSAARAINQAGHAVRKNPLLFDDYEANQITHSVSAFKRFTANMVGKADWGDIVVLTHNAVAVWFIPVPEVVNFAALHNGSSVDCALAPINIDFEVLQAHIDELSTYKRAVIARDNLIRANEAKDAYVPWPEVESGIRLTWPKPRPDEPPVPCGNQWYYGDDNCEQAHVYPKFVKPAIDCTVWKDL